LRDDNSIISDVTSVCQHCQYNDANSQNSLLDTVTGHVLDNPGFDSYQGKRFTSSARCPSQIGDHPVPFSMATRDSFPRCKVAASLI